MASNMCLSSKRMIQHSHVEAILPRLRRHAVMVTGSRHWADETVATCLRAYRLEPGQVRVDHAPADLFRLFHNVAGLAGKPARATGSTGCADTMPERLRLLGVLSPAQRRVLTLVTVEGFTVKEAADILGMAVDEASVLLGGARKALLAPATKPLDGPARRIKEA